MLCAKLLFKPVYVEVSGVIIAIIPQKLKLFVDDLL